MITNLKEELVAETYAYREHGLCPDGFFQEETTMAGETWTMDWQQTKADFLAGIKWARENPEWISVKEKMPDFDQYVLWYVASGNYFIEALDKDGNSWLEMPGNEVTHWMSLPPSPKEEK